jgi:acyl-CoA synthetase (NDP forming)
MILDALVADPAVGVVVCPITGAFPPMSDRLAQDLVDVAETTGKPICVVWGSPVGTEPAYRDILLGSSRLVTFRTFAGCVRALRAWVDWHEFVAGYRSPFAGTSRRSSRAAPRARALLAGDAQGAERKPGPLTEERSKAVLAEYGIPVTREETVRSPAEAVLAARSIAGDGPVVL